MTQAISDMPTPNYGSINRIGTNGEGRVIYQITDNTGRPAGKLSVAQQDCDVFEKSYDDIMANAPKLEKYARTTTPEKMMKKQKLAKWIVGGSGFLGALYPLLKVKGHGLKGAIKQLGLTLLGTVGGFIAGGFIASKAMTPPGATKISKATRNISKLDIQPVME